MNNTKPQLRMALITTTLMLGSVCVRTQARFFPSPGGGLTARVIPAGKNGFENRESRIEIKRANGRLIRQRSFASRDGQHGRRVDHAEWTPDGNFFVFNTSSSGGHQPWNDATYFYSRIQNRFYSLDNFIGPVTSDFVLKKRSTAVTTRLNFRDLNEKEQITVRLARLRL
jgi:hypothetical protein